MIRRTFLFVVSLAIVGCAAQGPGEGTGDSGKKLRVGMMPKLEGIPYFRACQKGAEQAAEELGIELIYDGPTDNRVEDQIQMLEEWIELGFDAIIIAPNDPEVIAPVLKRARDAGIIVVTFDADANPETSGRQAFCNQAPTDELAYAMVDSVAEQIGDKGKGLVVSTTPTAPNQNAWLSFMLPRLKEKYPDIELIETLYPAEDESRARQMTSDALAAHPDLKGIWGLSSVALPGAAQAVRLANKADEVAVTGVALPSAMREFVKDDTIKEFFLWNPVDLGYLSVYVVKELADGELKEGTKDIGRIKDVRTRGTEVILGPPTVFTKENVDEFDF